MTTMCAVCNCEVRTDDELCAICRRFARNPEPLEGGYWERDGLVMRWVSSAEPLPDTRCGTDAGYQAHRRNDELPCDECKSARAAKVAATRPHHDPARSCGTRAGYQQHMRRRETPCQGCTDAARAWQIEHRRRRRDAA